MPGLVIAVALEANVSDMLRSVIACPPREYLHMVGHAEEKNTEEDECLMVVDAAVGVGAMERSSKFTLLFERVAAGGHSSIVCSSALHLSHLAAVLRSRAARDTIGRQVRQHGLRSRDANGTRHGRGSMMMGREVWGAVHCAHARNH